MPTLARYVLILAAAQSVLSCTPTDRAPESRPADRSAIRTVRGFARYAHELREFTPCDSTTALWVVDSAQALWTPWRELAADGGEPAELFAVVEGRVGAPPREGFGAGYAGTLVVSRALYVAREGYGCAAPWDRFAVRAFGNEPFWSLTITADSLTLIRPGEESRTWRAVTQAGSDSARTFSSGDGDGIDVTVTARPCRDTMAGSYFGFSATARVAGDSLRGCALLGGG